MLDRRWGRAFILALALLLSAAARAVAAPIPYTVQSVPKSIGQIHVALDGDQLSTFSMTVSPRSCGAHTPSSDDAFVVSLPSPIALAGGTFQFQGQAPAAYYPNGGSADFTVSGQVTPDHRTVTGTLTISNGHDPFVSGCSDSFSFLGIPASSTASGFGAPQKHRTFVSQFLSFNYSAGVVKDLVAQVKIDCGRSVDSAEVNTSLLGIPAIHTSASGTFHVHSFVLDEYGSIVILDLSGRVARRRASGSIRVSEPPGFTGVAGDACTSDYSWTASKPGPPVGAGPVAFFDWNAVRVSSGAGYRYYFYISGLACHGGANAVQLSVAGRHLQISCAAQNAWASGPLAPGQSYNSTARAVRVRGGRVVKSGILVSEPLRMPGAGDYWRPIPPLPGNPPA